MRLDVPDILVDLVHYPMVHLDALRLHPLNFCRDVVVILFRNSDVEIPRRGIGARYPIREGKRSLGELSVRASRAIQGAGTHNCADKRNHRFWYFPLVRLVTQARLEEVWASCRNG